MAVTGVSTANQICTDALRKLGVLAHDEPATGNDIAVAGRELDRMLKAWNAKGSARWTEASMSVTVTAATSSFTLSVRPLRVNNVNFKQSGTERPLQRLTRDEYDHLPNKAATGVPTCYHFDKQRNSGALIIWPTLSAANGETLEITYTREVEDVDISSSDAIDVPVEWYDAVVWGLAANMAPNFGMNGAQLAQIAAMRMAEAEAMDRDDSVFFADWNYA